MTSRRSTVVASLAALIALASSTGVAVLGVSVGQLASSNAALRGQIEELGETPVVEPVIGETGAAGPAGERGPKGDRGEPGRAPTAAEIAGAVGEFCLPRNECRGAAGATGAPGSPGRAGTDGAAGEPGPAGPAGADGADGAPGAPGTPGADGQPPLAWTYTDALGISYSCTRAEPFDPTSPTYTCSAAAPTE